MGPGIQRYPTQVFRRRVAQSIGRDRVAEFVDRDSDYQRDGEGQNGYEGIERLLLKFGE